MIYPDTYGNLQTTDDEKTAIVNELVEELKLFKGENPLDIDAGLDYFAILNGEKFLQIEVEDVLEKHRPNFKSIDAGDVTLSEDGEQIIMPLLITFKDNEIVETNLVIDSRIM